MIRLTEGDLHSEESYNRAWENLWSQIDKNRMGINWDVYERYKGNPHAIKRWFDKWGIDVNEYLNEARNMNEKQIRLTESDLKQIVKESVNRVLKEHWSLASGYDELHNDVSKATDMAYDNIMSQYQERLKKWILDERAYATVADIIHIAIQQGMDFFLEQTSSGKHILKTMRR